MAMAARLSLRLQKELKLLLNDPPPGASFPSLSEDCSFSSLTSIDALIQGPNGTVYANGVFKIKIQIPERYPFQPPIVTFSTPIYHPNIDNGGRICLDILNLPPKGTWQPSLNISTVLTSIGLLLSEPNPDDGLMHDASREYKYYRQAFDQNARSMTEKCARVGESGSCSDSQENKTRSCPCPCPCPSITQTGTQVPDASTYTKCISSFARSGSKLSLGFPQSSSNIIYSESHDYVECGSSTSVGKEHQSDPYVKKLMRVIQNEPPGKGGCSTSPLELSDCHLEDKKDNPTLEKVTDQSAAMNRQSGKYDIPEDGIVLDSEDSEDEKVPMRRCLPVKRKRNRASY